MRALGHCLLALLPGVATSVLVARFAPLSEADRLVTAVMTFPLAWLAWAIPPFVLRRRWLHSVTVILFTVAATVTVLVT